MSVWTLFLLKVVSRILAEEMRKIRCVNSSRLLRRSHCPRNRLLVAKEKLRSETTLDEVFVHRGYVIHGNKEKCNA